MSVPEPAKQVAAELVVSPATVRLHVEHILDKLNLRSCAQIAVWGEPTGTHWW